MQRLKKALIKPIEHTTSALHKTSLIDNQMQKRGYYTPTEELDKQVRATNKSLLMK